MSNEEQTKTFRPTFDRVIVKMTSVEKQSVGGIYLAGSVSSLEGAIVSVGPIAEMQGFAKGMTVIIERGKATPFDINRPELAVVKTEDIVAVEETEQHRLTEVDESEVEPGVGTRN